MQDPTLLSAETCINMSHALQSSSLQQGSCRGAKVYQRQVQLLTITSSTIVIVQPLLQPLILSYQHLSPHTLPASVSTVQFSCLQQPGYSESDADACWGANR